MLLRLQVNKPSHTKASLHATSDPDVYAREYNDWRTIAKYAQNCDAEMHEHLKAALIYNQWHFFIASLADVGQICLRLVSKFMHKQKVIFIIHLHLFHNNR